MTYYLYLHVQLDVLLFSHPFPVAQPATFEYGRHPQSRSGRQGGGYLAVRADLGISSVKKGVICTAAYPQAGKHVLFYI